MKSTAESPVKLPFKSDFTVKFECNSRYLRSFETKAATPKGPFRVRFPAGVPNKKEPFGSFLFGFRCGSRPAVRPIAQQWHEERSDEVSPAGVLHQSKSAYECRRKRTARKRCCDRAQRDERKTNEQLLLILYLKLTLL